MGQLEKEKEQLQNEIVEWENLIDEQKELKKFIKTISENEEDLQLAEIQLSDLLERTKQFEQKILFQGKYDHLGVILSLQAGAGGTDAQDWTEILLRMYLRYAEKREWRTKILHESKGLEAGIKSVTIEISGLNVYGFLRREKGVHRLIRLSPFNSDNLRQTSFALVEVLPILDKKNELKINPTDLRVDTYRASGAGGQHINKTDSAVRITHLPTGIIVACQNERSQLQNREKAMEILQSKLAQLMEDQQAKKLAELKGEAKKIEWGNQIRSYILHPYKMLKDHRTGFQTSAVEEVLEGEMNQVIDDNLSKLS